MIYEKDTASNL